MFIGKHIPLNGNTVVVWILPLVLFINCVALSTKFKYLLIPFSCLGMITLSYLAASLLLRDLYGFDIYVPDYSLFLIVL